MKFEVLPEVVDREVELPGLRGAVRLLLQCRRDAPRLHRVSAEQHSGANEEDEQELDEESLVDGRHVSRIRAMAAGCVGSPNPANQPRQTGNGKRPRDRDSTPMGSRKETKPPHG